jgi:TPR repeat protein/beta-lactamase regulating signal transducer with metallopeptidase domain
MSKLQTVFSAEFIYALGWTILHSFWQCALVALLLAVILRGTKKQSSNTRYLFACSALVLCFVISLETFISYWQLARQARIEQTLELLGVTLPRALNAQSYIQQWLALADEYLLWIVYSWLLGCALVSLRNLVDYLRCVHLQRAHDQSVDEHWQATINRLACSIDLPRQVFMRISYVVDVPSTLGYFKPIVLIPAGLLTHLSQAQLEVILLHELGHIRRNDYAIGLIQVALKTLFFFNPMALWISTTIDEERENACDDIAVEQCQDALFYSKTLEEFAAVCASKNISMAISNNKMHLLNRIKRQFMRRKGVSRAIEKLMASIALISCCAAATVYAQTNSPAQAERFSQQLTETLLQAPALTKLPVDERLAAAKDYLKLADARQSSAPEKSDISPKVKSKDVNAEAVASDIKSVQDKQQPNNEVLSVAVPVYSNQKVSEALNASNMADTDKNAFDITVVGKLPPNPRGPNYIRRLDSERASNCNFSVTRSNYELEDGYLQSFYGGRFNSMYSDGGFSDNSPDGNARGGVRVPEGCTRSDLRFAAGRNYILRNDKTLDEAYAAYTAGNYVDALQIFKKSYRKIGYDEAAFVLGDMYLAGLGTETNISSAIEWYSHVAEARYMDKQRSPLALELEQASLKVQAQIKLARIYLLGFGVAKNNKLARHWYEESADLEYAPARYVLGQMNYFGFAGKQNLKMTEKLYTQAAESGFAPAQFALAQFYFASEDTPLNRKLAFKWYQHAAQNNHLNPMRPHAQLAIAEMYDQGRGIAADPVKALNYYKLAAVAGHPDAQNALAIYFYAGEIVEKDLMVARRLFSVAAEQGQADAMHNLALMNIKGEGGNVDLVTAYVWLNLAAKRGHSKATASAARLEVKLTPEQKIQADSRLSST